MRIHCKRHPFQQRAESRYFSAWRSVGALSAHIERHYPKHKIFVNDLVMSQDDHDRILHESDDVMVCGIPGDPLTVTILTSLAIGVALSAATIGITMLLRPKTPKLSGPEAQRNTITGAGNQIDPYGPIPSIIGAPRMFPRFPGKRPTQYTEIVGKDQYLRFLMLVGKGPLTINRSLVRIGNTRYDEHQDAEMQIMEGRSSDPVNTLYPSAVQEDSLAILLTSAASWQTQTTSVGVQRISVDWAYLNGLTKGTSNGGMDAVNVDVQIEYRLTGSSGAWSGFGSSRVHNHTFMADYPFEPLPGPIVVRSSGTDTRTVTVTGEHPIGTPVQDVLNLNGTSTVIGSVTFSKINTSALSAEDSDRIVTILRYHGEGLTGLRAIATLGSHFRTNGKTRSILRANHSWDVANNGTQSYDVRMRRYTNDSTDSRVTDQATWTALRSMKFGTPVLEPDCAYIVGRIRATDQLNGQIDNLSCQPYAMWRTYDGTAWGDYVVTRNCAWAGAGILTGKNNKRAIDLSELNGDSWKEFADWCTANDFECNDVMDTDSNVEDAVNAVLACGRGSLDNVDGKYVVVIDRQQTEIMNHFGPRNSWGFEGQATYPEETHALRIGFLNQLENFAEDEAVVFNDGYHAGNATKYDFLEYQRITNPSQIWKMGRYELADRKLQFERFSFNADFERLKCTRGDLILYSHDAMLVGVGWGLITSLRLATGASIAAIVIDSRVILDGAKTYGVQIRQSWNGATIEAQLVSTGGETNTLTFTEPILGASVGDLVTVGEWGQISQRCIVKQIDTIEDNGYLAARLTVAVEAPGRYTADQGEIPPHTPIITLTSHPLNTRPPEPFIRYIRSNQDSSTIQDNGSYLVNMSVHVAFRPGFDPALVYIQAQYRLWLGDDVPNPHPWILTPMEDGANGEIIIHNVDVILLYEVRVRALNKLNPSLISPWAASQTHEVLGDQIPPGPVTNFAATPGDRFVTVTWTNPDDHDFAATEIWMSDTTNDVEAAFYVKESSGESTTINDLENLESVFLWARARDWAGNPGPWHSADESPALLGIVATPAANVVVNKAEVRDAAEDLSTLNTSVLSLAYAAHGHKVTVRAKLYIYADANDPSATEFCEIALTKNGAVVDSYNLSFKHLGLGYPGEITLVYEDTPTVATHTYRLAYAGSTAVAKAVNLGIFVEEIEV